MSLELCNVVCILKLCLGHCLYCIVEFALYDKSLVYHSDAESKDGTELRLCQLYHLRNIPFPALPVNSIRVWLRSNGESKTVAHRNGVLRRLEGVLLRVLNYCYAAIGYLALLLIQKFHHLRLSRSGNYDCVAKGIVLGRLIHRAVVVQVLDVLVVIVCRYDGVVSV